MNRKRSIITLCAILVLVFCFSMFLMRNPASKQSNGFPDLAKAKSVIVYIPGSGKTKEVKLSEAEASRFRTIATQLHAQELPKNLKDNQMTGIIQCFKVELSTGKTVDVGLAGDELLIGEDSLWSVNHDAITSLSDYYQSLYTKYS